MPTRAELAAAYREKFPRYKDVPDDQLVEAILAKYPAYKDSLKDYEPTPGTAEATTRAIARSAGGIVPTQKTTDELGKDVGGRSMLTSFVRNPALQGAAHPTNVGDLLSLIIPQGVESVIGKVRGYNSAMKEAAAEPGSGGVWKTMKRAKDIVAERGGAVDRARLGVQVNMPNKSGASPAVWDESKANIDQMLSRIGQESPFDHYMPNVSSAEAPAMAVSHDRIPYGALREPSLAMDIGRLTGEKAPKLEDSLIDALRSVSEPETPSLVSSHPPIETVGEGPLKQSGKFGKSGSVGQPGGHTSGLPGLTEAEYDALLKRFGGRGGDVKPPSSAADYFRNTEPVEEWHSGAEPGTPEAKWASQEHVNDTLTEQRYRHLKDDPLASLLIALLGGGSAGAMMSSHETQP